MSLIVIESHKMVLLYLSLGDRNNMDNIALKHALYIIVNNMMVIIHWIRVTTYSLSVSGGTTTGLSLVCPRAWRAAKTEDLGAIALLSGLV